MPNEIIPITDIASTGVIQDTPSFALPPNAFSDVQDVRFRDNAVRKMTGEALELANADSSGVEAVYVAHWPSPAGNRYVVINRTNEGDYQLYVYDPDGGATLNTPAPTILPATSATPEPNTPNTPPKHLSLIHI